MINRRSALGMCGSILSVGFVGRSAFAQRVELPHGAISIVIPTAAGGQADTVGRLVGDRLARAADRPVIIEPKPGGGGLFAAQAVARAEPNGMTLLFVTGAHAILPGIHRNTISFDAVEDFSFISKISTLNFLICVGPDHPAKTFEELLDISRRSPGDQSFTSVGVGSTHHLIGELIQKTYGVKWTHVPYRGGTTGLMDVVANRVSIAIESTTTGLPMVTSRKVRALAVSKKPRLAQLPDVPALSEIAPGADVGSYLGLAAPARTPREIIALYNQVVVSAVADAKFRQLLEALGNTPASSTSEELTMQVRSDIERWSGLVETLGIPQ